MGQVTPSGEQPPTVSKKSTGDPPGLPSQLPDLSSSREILCLETTLVSHHQFFPLEPQSAKHGPPARLPLGQEGGHEAWPSAPSNPDSPPRPRAWHPSQA